MKKVVIVSGIQVINNPRVVKEADALSEAGYDVEVLAAVHDAESRRLIDRLLVGRRWRHTAVVDFTARSPLARLDHFGLRLKGRLARLLKRWTGIETPDQLGILTRRLYRLARAKRADLYIAHLEQALWVGRRLIEDGCAVAVDIEDWYSEDGLPADRMARPVALMRACERILLTGSVHSTTTSDVLAAALANAYGGQSAQVVHNSFPVEERTRIDGRVLDRLDRSAPSIIWFSQTIGPGRGLEALMAALGSIEAEFELHIRGTLRPGYRDILLKDTPDRLREQVHFHSRAPQDELLSRLAEHDIGYCGELSDCANHDLTIANKAFEYMRAGLAIVASDTAGQVEVAQRAPEAVCLFRQGDAASLRNVLEGLLTDAEALSRAKAAALAALETHFDWSRSKHRIQVLAREALGPTAAETPAT